MTRAVQIIPVLNGFICQVGCQQVVFSDKQSMITQLSEYYDNPEDVEKRFIGRATNKVYNNSPCEPCPPPTSCDTEACEPNVRNLVGRVR